MKNLFIDITDLIGKAVGSSKIIKISEKISSPDEENVKIIEEISGTIKFIKIENGIIGDCDLKGNVELNCSRCLKKYQMPIKLKYKQEFSYLGSKPINPDIQYIIYENKVDILPSLQQEILLAVPVKPLCNQRCKIN